MGDNGRRLTSAAIRATVTTTKARSSRAILCLGRPLASGGAQVWNKVLLTEHQEHLQGWAPVRLRIPSRGFVCGSGAPLAPVLFRCEIPSGATAAIAPLPASEMVAPNERPCV